jgi:histidinol-phosphate aminotransferase
VRAAELEWFMKRVPHNVLVILDEAYYEYAAIEHDYPDTIAMQKKRYENLIVLRTFSKIYSLAGLRVGYGIAAESLIGYLDRIRPPFNIARVSHDAALASLSDTNLTRKSIARVKQGKALLYRQLDALDISYVPSAGNFVLMRFPGISGYKLFTALLRKGVIVRAMDEYALPECIRVTIGKPDEMKIFIKALKEVLQET